MDADLIDADFKIDADLIGAYLTDADLMNADLLILTYGSCLNIVVLIIT